MRDAEAYPGPDIISVDLIQQVDHVEPQHQFMWTAEGNDMGDGDIVHRV